MIVVLILREGMSVGVEGCGGTGGGGEGGRGGSKGDVDETEYELADAPIAKVEAL